MLILFVNNLSIIWIQVHLRFVLLINNIYSNMIQLILLITVSAQQHYSQLTGTLTSMQNSI